MKRLRHAWYDFWFQRSSPDDLGLSRIVFFGLLLGLFCRSDVSPYGDVSPVFWMPIWLFRIVHLPQASVLTLRVLQVAWNVSLVFAMFGWKTRVNTLIAWILGIYLLGLPNCYGKIHHQGQLIVIILGILAFSRCGDAWSVDRWMARSRGEPRRQPSAEYSWPIQLVRVTMVLVFFAAGLAKLRVSGLAWVNAESFANRLIMAHYGIESVWNQWGMIVVHSQLACWMLAAVSLGIELASPLALVSRLLRVILIPALFLMQAGVFVLMGLSFAVYLCGYIFWVPWSLVVRRAIGDPTVEGQGPAVTAAT